MEKINETECKTNKYPHKYAQLNFDKGEKTTQLEKYCLFNKWYWSIWTTIEKNFNLNLTLYTKIDSKLIMNSKLKCKITELLRKK